MPTWSHRWLQPCTRLGQNGPKGQNCTHNGKSVKIRNQCAIFFDFQTPNQSSIHTQFVMWLITLAMMARPHHTSPLLWSNPHLTYLQPSSHPPFPPPPLLIPSPLTPTPLVCCPNPNGLWTRLGHHCLWCQIVTNLARVYRFSQTNSRQQRNWKEIPRRYHPFSLSTRSLPPNRQCKRLGSSIRRLFELDFAVKGTGWCDLEAFEPFWYPTLTNLQDPRQAHVIPIRSP